MEDTIKVANLKCNGCVTTVKGELLKIGGVQSVEVEIESDEVRVSYENVDRKVIIGRLHDLGYPEATERNGLLLQLKSYTSCLAGRVHSN